MSGDDQGYRLVQWDRPGFDPDRREQAGLGDLQRQNTGHRNAGCLDVVERHHMPAGLFEQRLQSAVIVQQDGIIFFDRARYGQP